MLFRASDVSPQWNGYLCRAKQIAQSMPDSEVQNPSCECLRPGSEKGGTSPTVAMASISYQKSNTATPSKGQGGTTKSWWCRLAQRSSSSRWVLYVAMSSEGRRDRVDGEYFLNQETRKEARPNQLAPAIQTGSTLSTFC